MGPITRKSVTKKGKDVKGRISRSFRMTGKAIPDQEKERGKFVVFAEGLFWYQES